MATNGSSGTEAMPPTHGGAPRISSRVGVGAMRESRMAARPPEDAEAASSPPAEHGER